MPLRISLGVPKASLIAPSTANFCEQAAMTPVQLQAALDALPIGIVVADARGAIVASAQREFRHSRNDTSAFITLLTIIAATMTPMAAEARTSLVQ